MPSRILDDECMGGGGMWDTAFAGGIGGFQRERGDTMPGPGPMKGSEG